MVEYFKSLFRFFSSLTFTLILLPAAMVLVFVGTLAQVELGLYLAQKRFFESFVIWAYPAFLSWPVPVFPGGFTLAFLFMINLTCGAFRYFRLGWSKAGIALIHGGVLFLVVGGLLTAFLSQESQMTLREGGTVNYSEDARRMELVFISETGDADQVVSFPQNLLDDDKSFAPAELPFTLEVLAFYPNAELFRVPPETPGPRLATHGTGRVIHVHEIPLETRENHVNAVTALLEFHRGDEFLGRWLVSNVIAGYQVLEVDNTRYWFGMRRRRYYYPFHVTLKEFTHDRYPGTEIPRNFSSLVHLDHPDISVARDVLIYMNHPLRYDGRTFYQASYGEEDTLSVLQVVKNPAWQVPYIASLFITCGMLVQFVRRLYLFSRRAVR